MAPIPRSRHFGFLPSGEAVEAWTLTGTSGLLVETITHTGFVTKLLYPVGADDWLDLILDFNELRPYLDGHPYFGAIVGRVAGNVSNATLSVDDETFRLHANEPPHQLNGGVHGFDKKLWTASPSIAEDGSRSIRLTYRSPHGEEGYPGNVSVSVTYTVTTSNAFVIETRASTDRPTPLSPTHHSYFNLAGESSSSIASHSLQVDADEFIAMSEDLSLSDRLRPVAGLPEDLRSPTSLAATLPQLTRGHGALYTARGLAIAGEPTEIAGLTHPAVGRTLTRITTISHLQVYIRSAFDGSITGKAGKSYKKNAGLCQEREGYPNGANQPDLGDIILRPGVPQHHTTIYPFSLTCEKDPGPIAEQKGAL